MPNTIDCSMMSHASCYGPDYDPDPDPTTRHDGTGGTGPSVHEPPAVPSYECVNQCVSSLGVTTLAEGTLAALGCVIVPEACPVFLGAAAGAVLGGCEAACEDLESTRP